VEKTERTTGSSTKSGRIYSVVGGGFPQRFSLGGGEKHLGDGKARLEGYTRDKSPNLRTRRGSLKPRNLNQKGNPYSWEKGALKQTGVEGTEKGKKKVGPGKKGRRRTIILIEKGVFGEIRLTGRMWKKKLGKHKGGPLGELGSSF